VKVLRLKNGSEEAEPLVATTMMILRDLIVSEPLHFYELTMVARDRTHRPFGRIGEDLVSKNLLTNRGGGGTTCTTLFATSFSLPFRAKSSTFNSAVQ